MNILIDTEAETISTTWDAFRADNAEGFRPEELGYIRILLDMDGEADISRHMHAGSFCRLRVAPTTRAS